jgi:ankyrin repeat protein
VAALNGHTEVVWLLPYSQGYAEAQHNDRIAVLHYAASNIYEAVVLSPLENRANIEAKDTKKGFTALHGSGREAMLLLLEKGVDIEAKDNNAWTALHGTAWNEQNAVIRLLLEKGANIEAKSYSITALYFAASKRSNSTVRRLLEKGAGPWGAGLKGHRNAAPSIRSIMMR